MFWCIISLSFQTHCLFTFGVWCVQRNLWWHMVHYFSWFPHAVLSVCFLFFLLSYTCSFLTLHPPPPKKKELCKGQIFILTWFLLSKMFGWVGIISSVSTTISPFLCLCWQVSSSWQISVDKNRFLVYNFVKNWLNVYYFAGITLYNVQWNSWRFPLRRCGCD